MPSTVLIAVLVLVSVMFVTFTVIGTLMYNRFKETPQSDVEPPSTVENGESAEEDTGTSEQPTALVTRRLAQDTTSAIYNDCWYNSLDVTNPSYVLENMDGGEVCWVGIQQGEEDSVMFCARIDLYGSYDNEVFTFIQSFTRVQGGMICLDTPVKYRYYKFQCGDLPAQQNLPHSLWACCGLDLMR